MFMHLLSVLRTLLIGPIPLALLCLNGLPFLELCIGLLVVWILWLVAFLFGLVRGSLWKKAEPRYLVQDVEFQCRVFRLVQALIFGRSCRFIGAFMRSLCLLPGGLGRFLPCTFGDLRLRHVGWEKGLVMALLLGLVKVPLSLSWMSFLG